jgi:hypothetical protein
MLAKRLASVHYVSTAYGGPSPMKYFRYSVAAEMTKIAEGKKTKLPVKMVVYLGLDHHPAIQKKVGKAFGITKG